VSTLYENYVLHHVTEYEAKQFFLFLTKENESSVTRERRFLLSEKVRMEVFRNIMCNNKLLDSTNIRLEGFYCFKTLFLTVNAEKKYIEFDNTGNYTVNQLNLLTGLDNLWDIVIYCNDTDVLNESRIFFVDVHAKTKPPAADKKAAGSAQIRLFLDKIFSVYENLSAL